MTGYFLDRVIKAVFPASLGHRLMRYIFIMRQYFLYNLLRTFPAQSKAAIMYQGRRECPADFDYDVHFNPRYDPWDQRVCVLPDGDFFKTLHSGKVHVVTDEIECFTETGIKLKNAQTVLEADMIVTATGLSLQLTLQLMQCNLWSSQLVMLKYEF